MNHHLSLFENSLHCAFLSLGYVQILCRDFTIFADVKIVSLRTKRLWTVCIAGACAMPPQFLLPT